MTEKWKIDDLVWAKMKGYKPWPGRVVKPGPNTKKPASKNMQWIYFFGSNNYAWIEETGLKPYQEFKNTFMVNAKAKAMKDAIEKIESYIQKKLENPDFDIDDLMVEDVIESEEPASSPKPKPKKSVTKRSSDNSFSKTPAKKSKKSIKLDENGDDSKELSGTESPSQMTETNNDDSSAIVPPPNLVFGFIGCGVMGSRIVKNLVKFGHRVNIYNRTPQKSQDLKIDLDETSKSSLCAICETPFDIVSNSDVIFCCVSDMASAKKVMFDKWGVLTADIAGKGIVEMTGIDLETSLDFSSTITTKGGRYLEAQIQGSRKEAEDGNLVILTSGDESLFRNCQSIFRAIGKTAFFLGKVGYAIKMNNVMNLTKSVALVGLAEAMSLADKLGLSRKDVLSIFNVTTMACPYLKGKAERMVNRNFSNPDHALQHMQKDLSICLGMSDDVKLPLMVAASAKEMFKNCRSLGWDDKDCACIFDKARL